jgi:hypothetical protein
LGTTGLSPGKAGDLALENPRAFSLKAGEDPAMSAREASNLN